MQVVLHIGAPKTGTSSMQANFTLNRDYYLGHGVLYPKAGCVFGKKTIHRHVGARFAAKGLHGPVNGLMDTHGLDSNEARQAYKDEFLAAFDSELSQTNPRTVLLSDEALFSFSEPEMIKNLSGFLRERFDNIKVYCWLRAPLDYVRGTRSQSLKAAKIVGDASISQNSFPNGIYLHNLDAWAQHFTADEMRVAPARGDFVAAIANVIDVPPAPSAQTDHANTSLTQLGYEYLSDLNARYDGRDRPVSLRKAFEDAMTGTPFKLPVEETEAVIHAFRQEVEELTERHVHAPEDQRFMREEWTQIPKATPQVTVDAETRRVTCDLIEALAENNERRIANQVDINTTLRAAIAKERDAVSQSKKALAAANKKNQKLDGALARQRKWSEEQAALITEMKTHPFRYLFKGIKRRLSR